MKRIITTIMCLSTIFSATAADIYVNNSGVPGTYNTIGAAVAASAPGDRILISPYSSYLESLTLVQDVTIVSSVPNTRPSILGDITVVASPDLEVTLIGLELSGDIIVNNTGNPTITSYANITVVDCDFDQYLATQIEYVKSTLLFNKVRGGSFAIRGGLLDCRGNTLSSSSILVDELSNYALLDTVKIVGNKLSGTIRIDCDDYFYDISNNYCNAIDLNRNAYSALIQSYVTNNSVRSDVNYSSGTGYNWSNCYITNNVRVRETDETCAVTSGQFVVTGTLLGQSFQPICAYNFRGSQGSDVTNPILDLRYTTSLGNSSNDCTLACDSLGRLVGLGVDDGSPALEFYDIDMTPNDLGSGGGPNSITNYFIDNASGRARVYDLEIPFEIFSGQTPSVSAKSTHLK